MISPVIAERQLMAPGRCVNEISLPANDSCCGILPEIALFKLWETPNPSNCD